MGRTKGAINKTVPLPDVCALTAEQRLELLANLIIDRILEDQNNGQKLLKSLGQSHERRKTATA